MFVEPGRDYAVLREEAIQMAQDGIEVADIAHELEVSRSTVYRWFSEEGIEYRKPGDAYRDNAAEIIDAYNRGDSVSKICKEFSINHTMMYTILEEFDVPRRVTDATEKGRVRALDTAVEMYVEGAKLRKIQAETGVYSARLYAELEKRGISNRSAGRG